MLFVQLFLLRRFCFRRLGVLEVCLGDLDLGLVWVERQMSYFVDICWGLAVEPVLFVLAVVVGFVVGYCLDTWC